MKRVLVVGDVIADVYRDCSFKKMCPDAPKVRALVETSCDMRPGGAANVALNLAALAPDAQIHLIGELDGPLGRTIKYFSKNRVNMDFCEYTEDPITKERIILDGEMQLRVDNKLRTYSVTAEGIEWHLKQYLATHDPDLIVLSDYGAGSVNAASLEVLLSARDRLLVDTKMTDLSVFGEGSRTKLVKLNRVEWEAVIASEAAPERFFDALVRTWGDHGAFIDMHEQTSPRSSVTHTMHVAAHKVPVADVCGCGDTFMAGLAASLLKNSDYFTALQFANAASATVVSKPRTSVADLDLTLELLGREREQ